MPDRTHRVFLRNVLSSWASRAIVLAVTFVVTPLVVHGLGKTQYGLWAIGFTLMGYFTLLDVGVNGGMVSMVSEAKARGENDRIAGYVATALVFYLLVGAAMVVAVYLVRGPLGSMLGVPASLMSTAGNLFVAVTAYLVIVNTTGVFSSVLGGVEAIHLSSTLNLGTSLLTSAGLVIVLKTTRGGISGLIGVYIVVALLTLVVTGVLAARASSPLHLRPSLVSWSRLKEIARLGLTIQISNMAGIVNYSIDKLIVAGIIGLVSAGLYDLGSRLAIVIWTMAGLVAQSAFPATSRLAQESPGLVVSFYVRAERYLLVTVCGLSGLLFTVAPWLIAAWLGPGYAKVVLVTRLLSLATAGLCMSNVAKVTMWGLRKQREVMTFEVWRLTMHILLSCTLTWKFGLMGALTGALISLTLPSMWLIWITHRRLQAPYMDWLRSTFAPPFLAAVSGAVGAWFLVGVLLSQSLSTATRINTLSLLVLAGLVFSTIYFAVLVRFHSFEDDDLAAIQSGRNAILRWVRASMAMAR